MLDQMTKTLYGPNSGLKDSIVQSASIFQSNKEKFRTNNGQEPETIFNGEGETEFEEAFDFETTTILEPSPELRTMGYDHRGYINLHDLKEIDMGDRISLSHAGRNPVTTFGNSKSTEDISDNSGIMFDVMDIRKPKMGVSGRMGKMIDNVAAVPSSRKGTY